MGEPVYRRVVVKLSGEYFAGGDPFGIHQGTIDRIAKGTAEAHRAPPPEMKVNLEEFTPALLNDAKLTKRLVGLFGEVIGAENVKPRLPVMGGEDFGRFASTGAPDSAQSRTAETL